MIKAAIQSGERRIPDETTLKVIIKALGEYLENQSEHRTPPRSAWRERRTNWRFSGRTWTGPAHESRNRPRR
ncbi:MAG TPA: hypothetical protein VMU99_03300 [Acidimicrobiales bacterium]|nr:hypothetical protein [Acidimicrobiales bacterium]